MVRISERHPNVWNSVIERFSKSDDDYVLERILTAAYGCFLRTQDKDALNNAARVIYQIFFQNGLFTENAMIIDYARSIIQFAKQSGLLADLKEENFLPPYTGDVKIDWPDEKYMDGYKDTYWVLPKLHRSCTWDDFQKYTVPGIIRKYEDEGVTLMGACRWIFKHVLEMGYAPDLEATEFDKYLLDEYGGGRSRPEWAERIGKKYQWIAMYRLAEDWPFYIQEKKMTLSRNHL